MFHHQRPLKVYAVGRLVLFVFLFSKWTLMIMDAVELLVYLFIFKFLYKSYGGR
jgi:hypothetical protein